MPSDYYVVLGISRNADTSKIKRAYRSIVRQYHPDTAKTYQNAERFNEIREAYETLTDETRRRQYDSELEKQNIPIRISKVSETVSRRRSVYEEMERFSSFTDEFFEGLLPGFFHKERFRGTQKDLYLEAMLSPREALEGGMYPVSIPVIEPCPICHKRGLLDSFFCPQCLGYGRIQSERRFSLTIPPDTRHGTKISLSLEDIGLKNVRLHILALVDPGFSEDEW